MMIIHFLILLIFLILFFWTARIEAGDSADEKDGWVYKRFLKISLFILKFMPAGNHESLRKKHGLLSPSTGGKAETHKYMARKTAELLLIVFFGNALGMCVTCADMAGSGVIEGNALARNSYGEGDSTASVTAEIGGKKLSNELQITIGERRYDDSETEFIFDEMENRLAVEILGENKSLEYVDHDLRLIETLDDLPVSISWRPDNYDILDGEGKIREYFQDPKGEMVVLTAELSYFDHRREVQFPIKVYPAVQSTEDSVHDALLRKISRFDEETASSEKLVLPDRIGGYSVTYRRAGKRTGALILFLAFLCGGAVYAGRDRDLNEKLREREKEMLRDYPEILSKMTLLFSAGMTMRGTIEKLVRDYEKRQAKTGKKTYAYEELKVTLYEMNSGIPESQAYENLGNRAGIRHYSRLGSMLSQNLRKGSAGLLHALEQESAEAFAERKASARKRGEEAGTKLLLPMGIMLMIVMVIVIVPAFLSFNL